MIEDWPIYVLFAAAAILATLVTRRLYSQFKQAVQGRDYTLSARTLFTDDPTVKAHYKTYLWQGLWQNGLIFLVLIIGLVYVAG